jgi:hypothetical protein
MQGENYARQGHVSTTEQRIMQGLQGGSGICIMAGGRLNIMIAVMVGCKCGFNTTRLQEAAAFTLA